MVVQLEKLSGEIIASGRTEPLRNKREVIWDTTGETPGSKLEQAATGSGNTQKPFTVNLGKVSHSGKIGDGDEIYDATENKEMHYVHIIVKNDIDGLELGAQKIEIDELIDPKHLYQIQLNLSTAAYHAGISYLGRRRYIFAWKFDTARWEVCFQAGTACQSVCPAYYFQIVRRE